MQTPLVALAAILLTACASYDGRGLVSGSSTEADVQSLMGKPAETLASAAGERVWFYPHAPAGRDTYAVRFGADGRVVAIEQRLTEENFARLAAGNTTRQVRELLGPPNRAFRNDRQERVVWEYLYYNAMQIPFILYVQASDDGVVREVVTIRDPSQDTPGGYS